MVQLSCPFECVLHYDSVAQVEHLYHFPRKSTLHVFNESTLDVSRKSQAEAAMKIIRYNLYLSFH